MGKLKNKVALITGSTKSIGLEIAKLFHMKGATVIMTGRAPKEKGLEIAKAIGITDYISLDVSSEANWHDVAQYVAVKYKRLDILVNNAGIDKVANTDRLQDLEHCTLEDWQAVHAVNLDGTFLGCKTMMPLLIKSEHASIINMGSRSGLVGVPSYPAYSSSKAALLNFTKTVAMHCTSHNYPVRCNIIVPAAILTDIWDLEFGRGELRQQRIEEYARNIPLKRMGQADEVAKLAVFLACDDSLFITGAQYIIDGGTMAGTGSYNTNNENKALNNTNSKDDDSLIKQEQQDFRSQQVKNYNLKQNFFASTSALNNQLKEDIRFNIAP
ncbi:SDR family NAD(P)-dependent oxidoreductase [Legionella sp. D16C41]|uniref:SDR family NAD(P)-dependent oxidoreductase n=1 Tax=Legionella sp. D16C41 TaxID=3402688 RepID=UPI003AF53D99